MASSALRCDMYKMFLGRGCIGLTEKYGPGAGRRKYWCNVLGVYVAHCWGADGRIAGCYSKVWGQ